MGKGFEHKNKNKTGVVSIIGVRCGVWWQYLRNNKWEWKYFSKILLVSLIVLVGIPFRFWERLKLGKKIKETKIHDSPVFILGHWRGGTTLLHNLLSMDKQFGYVTYLQGLFPHAFLASNFFRFVANNLMPSKRPMDNMDITTESPQEEELALISQSGHSVYNMWVAPDTHAEVWKNYGKFENEELKRKWSEGYLQLLKTATFNFDGKRLLLKNPPNTARIPYLLEQFPNAKFIYIYRNPYKVFASTYKLYQDVINFFQIHDEDEENVVNNFLHIYKDMHEVYQRDKNLIPKGNLLEVKFEDFVNNKMDGLADIYSTLGLGDFNAVRPTYDSYLSSIKDYKKNKLRTDRDVLEKVNEHWDFAFEAYGYEREA